MVVSTLNSISLNPRSARTCDCSDSVSGKALVTTALPAAPDRLTRLACLRPLARMGEEIGDDEMEKFEAVASALETEFHDLVPAPEGAR